MDRVDTGGKMGAGKSADTNPHRRLTFSTSFCVHFIDPLGTAPLNQTGVEALAWLESNHPELFVDSNGRPMNQLDYKAVNWLKSNAGLTVGQNIYVNMGYMETAKVESMVWLLSHELQHARLGFWGNVWKMRHSGEHDKLDAEIAHPIMQEYIEQTMRQRRNQGNP